MITPLVLEPQWRASLDALPSWQPVGTLFDRPTVVISPHPDDETLGVGGLIAHLRSRDTPVSILAVTDGENAYDPYVPGLAQTREHEQTAALARLGVPASCISRLHLPDSGLHTCESRLEAALNAQIPDGAHIVAPWPHDFHPDHEACGRAATRIAAARHLPLTFYVFWTWHRGTPDLLTNLSAVRLPLSPAEQLARHEALLCHTSQLHRAGGDPILPSNLLDPVRRPFEVFLPA